MTVPGRYRLALRAYPKPYRRSRGAELLTTLADGDDERGRPSNREALALAGRGLAMRAGLAVSGPGLLGAAGGLLLAAAMAPQFMWAEDTIRLGPGVIMAGWEPAPGLWLRLALAVVALSVLANAVDAGSSWRRRAVVAVAAFAAAVGVFGAIGRIFVGVPNLDSVVQLATWLAAVVADEWLDFTLAVVAAVGGALTVLLTLARLRPVTRRRMLAAALAVLGAIALAQAWSRPAEPGTFGIYEGEYVHGQVEALGVATLLAALGLVLALAALWRMRTPR